MSIKITRLFVLAVFALLAGCHLTPTPDSEQKPAIWDSTQKIWVNEQQLSEQLERADYALVGELHNNVDFRERLTHILSGLKPEATVRVIALDALPADQALSDNSNNSDHSHPTINEQYQPLLSWAKQQNASVMGIGTPRETIKALKDESKRKALADKINRALDSDSKARLRDIMKSCHLKGDTDTDRTDYMVAAHQCKDSTMADQITLQNKKALLLIRAFHARTDLGVGRYINLRQPNAKVTSILMYSPESPETPITDFIEDMQPFYDFIWIWPNQSASASKKNGN